MVSAISSSPSFFLFFLSSSVIDSYVERDSVLVVECKVQSVKSHNHNLIGRKR